MTCFDEEPEHQPSKEDWEAFEQSQFPAWQPIATAPKDGTNILVWWPAQFHCPVTAHWNTGKWSDAGIGWKISGWGDVPQTEPTHWTSLPTPPMSETAKEE